MGPDVGAVEIYEDGDIAHDANGTFCAIGPKRLPLLEEKELNDAPHVEILEHFHVRLLQRHGIAMGQWAWPAVPAFQLETRAQTVEEDEVVEPPFVLPAEALVARPGVWCSGAQEVVCRFKKQG